MKKKSKNVRSWDELIKLVENMNPYKNTIILNGFINEIAGDKLIMRELIFRVEDIEILRNGKDGKNNSKQETKGKKSTKGSSKKSA